MARSQLLPGFGSRTTQTVALTSGAAQVFTDEFEVSRLGMFGMQVTTWAAGNLTVQLQQSLDGTNFSNIGSPVVMVAGDIARVPITSGPFGIIRYGLLSTDTSASATLTTVGFNLPWSN